MDKMTASNHEIMAERSHQEKRVLMLAPTQRDAKLSAAVLTEAGLVCSGCADLEELYHELAQGAGCLLIAESVLLTEGVARLAEALRLQPAWSGLPVIVLTRGGATESPLLISIMESLSNLILLEIPVRISTLLSTLRTALLARARQYQIRDQLVALKQAEDTLRISENRLKDSERRLTDIIEFLPDATFALDNAGRIIAWNKAMEELTGAPAVEVLGKGNREYSYRLYGKRIPCLADEVLSGDQPDWLFSNLIRENDIFKAETYIPHLKPGGVWLSIKVAPIYDAKGNIVGVIDACRDMTERKRAEEALRQSEARFRGTFENSAIGMTHIDLNGNWLLVNQRFCDLVGYSREELVGKKYWDLTHPEDIERDVAPYAQLIHGKLDYYDLEKRYIAKDGHDVWVYISRALQRDSEGKPIYTITNAIDITARKAAETQLRLQATALDAAANGIIVTDPNGTIQWANPAYASMIGYEVHEVIGKNPRIAKSNKQDHAFYRAMWETIQRGEIWHGELINCRKDGTLYNEEMVIAPVVNERGEISQYIAIKQDITERKQADEVLRKSEAHLQRVLDGAFPFLGVMTPDGVLTYVNRSTLEVSGLRPEDVLGKLFDEVHWWSHSTDVAAQIREAVVRGRRGEAVRFDTSALVAGDRQILIDFALTPLRDEQGRITHLIPSAVDITNRKQAEGALQKANNQLAEADQRKDEFLAMLAHELRNPLAPIRYAAQMLNMNGLGQEQIQKQHEVIDRQVSHMGRLLDDLLDVSRITRGKIQLKREIVDLRTVARQALDSMRSMIEGRGQHLAYEGPSSPLPVDGDPTRLEQIIRNLLHNANKYTEAGGCIKLSLGLETEHQWRAVVRVIDSGIGITPEMLPRVFDLFSQAEQALDRTQGGLGIGLAMVKSIVQMHGGSVEAHSVGLGHGSEFVVRLSLATEVMGGLTGASAPMEPSHAAQSKPRRVLVVDDNEDSAASLGDLLSLWGHEIQTAHDGKHALAAARQWQPEIILLDIGLPGMDGYEVARRLREDPTTSGAFLVALTGYGQEEDRRRAHEAGFNQHLTKPVELGRLQNLLNEALMI